MPSTPLQILLRTVPVWIALMALLGLTIFLSYVPLGRFNVVFAIGIASLQALLIAVFFMHLKRPDPLLRLAGAATLIWLFFMFALTLADILERVPLSQPGTVMPLEHGSAPATGKRAF
ncbi:MAG: cytochrome C oxidase subunit IV family protein [Acetobacteraceae bacterium]